MTDHRTASVPADLDGARLDAVAARLFPDHSRARLKDWIEAGRLSVNGAAAARSRQAVREGDVLALDAEPAAREDALVAQPIALDVAYADEALAVIVKPAGLTAHPGAGQPDGTLVNALLHRWPQTAALPRAGLVHRLDKDTSGLLVVALTPAAHTRLVAAMAARRIKREYDALVNGAMTAGGTIDAPIGRDPHNRLRMAVVDGGRPAVTHYRVHQRFTHHTHLRVRLETGRTHQIRVHLSYLKHPIAGDAVYGGRLARGVGMAPALRESLRLFPRQALHARELAFQHPVDGRELRFIAEPPADLQTLLAQLRAAEPVP